MLSTNKKMTLGITLIMIGVIFMAILGGIGNHLIQEARTEKGEASKNEVIDSIGNSEEKILEEIGSKDNLLKLAKESTDLINSLNDLARRWKTKTSEIRDEYDDKRHQNPVSEELEKTYSYEENKHREKLHREINDEFQRLYRLKVKDQIIKLYTNKGEVISQDELRELSSDRLTNQFSLRGITKLLEDLTSTLKIKNNLDL